jgi:hypothetical protein
VSEVIRSLDSLFPPFAENVAIYEKKVAPFRFYIFETYRSFENQMENYKKGRELKNGEWIVVDPTKVVTKAKPGMSLHAYGLAFDSVPDGNSQKQGIQWDWNDYDVTQSGNQKIPWDLSGKAGKELGFEWAGDWIEFKEMPHFQNRYGYKVSELYPVLINDGLESVWKMIMKKIKPEIVFVSVPVHIVSVDEKESTAASSVITKPEELNQIVKVETSKNIFSYILSKLSFLFNH